MPSLQSRILRFFLRGLNFVDWRAENIVRARRWEDAAVRIFPVPCGVSVEGCVLGNVPGEWLIPPGAPEDRALFYIHGGGFVMGSLATHRVLVARLAHAAGARAFSVDYRLAPEHRFPAALEDCRAAYRGLLQTGFPPRRIVVAGDSAGGNLALTLLLMLRDAGDPLPAAVVCLSPVTDLAFTGESFRTKAKIDPLLTRAAFASLSDSMISGYVGSEDPRNPLISPLYADLHRLPPVLLHVGEDEILLDDSVQLAQRVREAGGRAEVAVWEGMWHVFQVFAPLVPESNRSIAQIGDFIRRMQQGGK
jgi:acetyl esterase/lipase